jgi:alpha-amylase/alpha-mannosidase (GH57 family)
MTSGESAPMVDLVLLWHHHQPDYRDPRDGRSRLPWVRLHATKDYLDMARRLTRFPGVRVTFNFVSSLIDQLDAAAAGGADELFDLLARPVAELDPEERREMLWRCVMAPPWSRERWPSYARLLGRLAGCARADIDPGAWSEADLLQLQCGFLLAWLDPDLHDEPEARRATDALEAPEESHRDALLTLHSRLVGEVLPAYRAGLERGQFEISHTAYYHPILPLLVANDCARRALPGLSLPGVPLRAEADASAQITRAIERHMRAFGVRPAGMWPSEGSVSPEIVEIASHAGVRWMASDEAVLERSLGRPPGDDLYRPWRLAGVESTTLFFRDRTLSDQIGFVYAHLPADVAVADFVGRLREIADRHADRDTPVVAVILDGENCWEHYESDGGPFLDAFYAALESELWIRTRTPSEFLEAPGFGTLDHLHTGSWIDADFHIWIGHPEKNRAWELLAATRERLVRAGADPVTHPHAWEALYAAEGSDWFWWLGEDHVTSEKPLFDQLMRLHLMAAHERAGLDVPGALHEPIVRGEAGAGVLRPMGLVRPTIDGRRTHYYEWDGAGREPLGAGGGAMHHGRGLARELLYGFDLTSLYLRLDFPSDVLPGGELDLHVDVLAPRPTEFRVRGLERGERAVVGAAAGTDFETPSFEAVAGARAWAERVVEVALPFTALDAAPGDTVAFIVRLVRGGRTLEVIPPGRAVRFQVPDGSFEEALWSA